MTNAQQNKLNEKLGAIAKHGGAFRLNGADQDQGGIVAGLSCLNGSDNFQDLFNLLDLIRDTMKLRQLPLQYIPNDEGDAPMLDFKVDCDRGTCPIGSKWNRRASDDQKDWD